MFDTSSATVGAATSQGERARPIETAPIGGGDYFPPRTPGEEPLKHVLLWQPPHGRWPGGWRLGFWGGARQPVWFDDYMSRMDPQPTHWAPLPEEPAP